MDEHTFQEMFQYVSTEKQARINRFRKRVDAIRSLVGDLIIRFILCKHHGLCNNEILYHYKEFGKPYLPHHPHLHFNISHSGDWVAGVVADSPVGIDIEKIADLKTDIFPAVLTKEENKKLHDLNYAEMKTCFFELWTLKESYIKATGRGLSEGLNTLEVLLNQERISIKKNGKTIQAYFEKPECISGYKFSLCSFSQSPVKDSRQFSIHEFSQMVNEYCKTSETNIVR